jgi:hypothetical protein
VVIGAGAARHLAIPGWRGPGCTAVTPRTRRVTVVQPAIP